MKLTGQAIIEMKKQTSQRDDEYGFYAINPTTGEALLPKYAEASTAQIHHVGILAGEAFKQMQALTDLQRAEFLSAIGDEIMALGEALIDRAEQETALPRARLMGERGRTCAQLQLFADLLRDGSWCHASIDTADAGREPLPKPDVRSMRVGIGPVVVFAASNFPLAFSVAGGDTASAFAAGCPVIIKAHPSHPGTSELVGGAIMRAIEKTNMPDAIFALIHGKENATGASLVEHPSIKAVSFTGSHQGGRALYNLATSRQEPIPVYAEMGSVNPLFLLDNDECFDRDTFADNFIASFTLGVGQFCTSPGVLVVNKSQYLKPFLDMFKEKLALTQAGTMLNEQMKQSLQAEIKRLKGHKEIELLDQGQAGQTDCGMNNWLFKIDAEDFIKNNHFQQERFGPLSMVVVCENNTQMLQVAESLMGQLTASIHTTQFDHQSVRNLTDVLTRVAGRVIFNEYPTGVEICSSMVHGGPYPASTPCSDTAIGDRAIYRFTRSVCYQNTPQELLPSALKNNNPLGIYRIIDGQYTDEALNSDKDTLQNPH